MRMTILRFVMQAFRFTILVRRSRNWVSSLREVTFPPKMQYSGDGLSLHDDFAFVMS